MTDPLEVIEAVRLRLARQAAARTLLAVLPALAVTGLIAALLRPLGAASWERTGRALPGPIAVQLQLALLAAAGLGLVICAVLAYRAFVSSADSLGAAELIDRRLASHQEMVTLATVAGAAPAQRSPLFPLLMGRASLIAGKLKPSAVFPLELGGVAKRALALAAGVLILIAAAVAMLVSVAGSTLALQAHQLRKLADQIAAANTGPQQQGLAEQLKAAARALENPQLPPQTKLEQLAAAQQAIEQARQPQTGGGESSGTGKGAGNQARANGQGQSGSGTSSGAGEKGGQNEQGPGKGSGTSSGHKNAPEQMQIAEAEKNLAKAQAQVMEQSEGGNAMMPRPQAGANSKGQGPNQKPGENRIQTLSRNLPGNQPKSDRNMIEHRRITTEASTGSPARKDSGSNQGDTHLGEMPQPGKFERFYKPGEKGPQIEIRDARYVLFRIPQTIIGSGGGRTVIDKEHPQATVAFQNLPLSEEQIKAEPDERQLVPPRYRDLLRSDKE